MSKVAAIFDLDGTLCSAHIWKGFRKYYIEHEKKRMPLTPAFLITHLPLWLLCKCKLLNEEKCMVKWAEDLNAVFRGASAREVLEASLWVVDNHIVESLRNDIVAILDQHKQNGHMVIIISAALSNLLEIVGQKLGVPDVIGTKLEVSDDRYTGKTIKPACFGRNKVKLLGEFISRNELEIDLPSSFAYADSVFDIPLLKLVGNPVATYPDRNLRQFAEHSGWQILP